MTDHESFFANIAANSRDDAPRLVYADWLEENDDPERAEFIRLEVALANNADTQGELPAVDIARMEARKNELLARNEAQWLQPLRELGVEGRIHGEFTRGYVEKICISAATFVEHGDKLLRATPVTQLYLSAPGAVGRRLADCPHLARIHSLDLSDEPSLSRTDLVAFLESPHTANLRSLSLWDKSTNDEDVAALATASKVPALDAFTFSATKITGATLPALLSRMRQLERFSLDAVSTFDPNHLADMLAVLNPGTLKTLSFWHSPIRTVGIRALAETPGLTGLEDLWCRDGRLDASSMEALAAATHLNMKELHLGDDWLTTKGGEALATWPGLASLRELELDYSRIGGRGVIALTRSPYLGSLEELMLRENRMGDGAA